MNSVVLRSTGLAALTLSLFFGCGGRVESEYESATVDEKAYENPEGHASAPPSTTDCAMHT